MAYVQRGSVTITTATGGGATGYIIGSDGNRFNGRLSAIKYTKTDFASTVDFTITSEDTGQTLWTESNVNASATKYPTQLGHSGVGAALATSGAGSQPIFLAGERIKIAVASGGNVKTGAFAAVVG